VRISLLNTASFVRTYIVILFMVVALRDTGMAIETKSRNHIADNSFVMSTNSEQQSISSEISNPRQQSKDQQQLMETLSSLDNNNSSHLRVVMMDEEQPIMSIASPPLSPEVSESKTTNTVKLPTTPPKHHQHQEQHQSPLLPKHRIYKRKMVHCRK
jgi:hypothetical protein